MVKIKTKKEIQAQLKLVESRLERAFRDGKFNNAREFTGQKSSLEWVLGVEV